MQNASLLKRFAALLYDSIITIALLFVGSAVTVLFEQQNAFFPLYFFRIYLIFFVSFYFILSWMYGGQTIGMKVWGLKLEGLRSNITFWRAMLRYLLAVMGFWGAGIGLFWCCLNKNKQSLPDLLSGTRMIAIPASKKATPK